uniref:Peptidase S1 domain-containing protein n=1 Tax=Poecilia mexicana TaxID=48701 RepID=A0A3B3Z407_9TELE
GFYVFYLCLSFCYSLALVRQQPHSLPFMALLASHESICGGTLIDSNWVLTAALLCKMNDFICLK